MRHFPLAVFLLLAPLAVMNAPALAADVPATKTVTLNVENMSCAGCPITVRKALEKVPGVTQAKVDYGTRTATVTLDPAKTGVEALTRATTNAGYPSTLRK
jgi:mercuric ion binding protein